MRVSGRLVPRVYKMEVDAKMRQFEAQGDRSLKEGSIDLCVEMSGDEEGRNEVEIIREEEERREDKRRTD